MRPAVALVVFGVSALVAIPAGAQAPGEPWPNQGPVVQQVPQFDPDGGVMPEQQLPPDQLPPDDFALDQLPPDQVVDVSPDDAADLRLPEGQRRAHEQAPRPGLPLDRLRPLHARRRPRRAPARRPLVVGEPREQGMRPARRRRRPLAELSSRSREFLRLDLRHGSRLRRAKARRV